MRETSGPDTALAGAFCDAVGVRDVDDLFEAITRGGLAVGAERAPLVLDVAAGGDAVAQALLAEQGRSLADEVLGVARRLRMLDGRSSSWSRAACTSPGRCRWTTPSPRAWTESRRVPGSCHCASPRSSGAGKLALDSWRRRRDLAHAARDRRAAGGRRSDARAGRRARGRAGRAPCAKRGLDRVVLVARGTSDHVAIYARYLLEARCALSASLAAPSLYTTYRPPVDLSRALVLGVSQSGQTPEIVAALEFAAGRGALTAALTNEAGSPLADALSSTRSSRRRAASSRSRPRRRSRRRWPRRRAGAGARSGRPGPGSLNALARTLDDGGRAARRRSSTSAARSLLDAEAAVCISRGYAYATALEAALKLKEVAGLWAEGFSAADLRHGPRAAALGLPALVFHAGGPARGRRRRARARARRGADRRSSRSGRGVRCRPPGLREELAPIALIVPAQLVAERLAVLRGRDPDGRRA